jgi:hypothetical protein
LYHSLGASSGTTFAACQPYPSSCVLDVENLEILLSVHEVKGKLLDKYSIKEEKKRLPFIKYSVIYIDHHKILDVSLW